VSVTRRNFLATTGWQPRPFRPRTTNKSGSKLPIVGGRDHQYEAIHDWGQPPANIKSATLTASAKTRKAHLHPSHVHADSESATRSWSSTKGGKFVAPGESSTKAAPHGLMLRKEGTEEFLYLCDYAHAIALSAR